MSDDSGSPVLLECDSPRPDGLENQISKLQALLENEIFVLDTECLLEALEQCFIVCPAESLEERIFKKILPTIHHFLSQVVKSIDDAMNDNAKVDDVKHKLNICNDVLSFWQKCIEHISTLEKIRAIYVTSFCNILPETIKVILEHCKASPTTYGIILNEAMQELKNLFSRAGAIFKLYFVTLDNVIIFNTDVKSETELLMKVVDAHGSIASVAYGMDTKTFIEMSEAFAKLAVTHQNYIKRVSPNSVTIHLNQMTENASCLTSTIKEQTDKIVERVIAAVTRLIQILEKLITIYGTFLTCEMLLYQIELTAQIYGCLCVNITKTDRRTISVNTTAFLDVIFNHDNFMQAYFEYGKRDNVDRLNYHLLTIAIMRKLNSVPYEHHCKWFLNSDSILDSAFVHIQYLQDEICIGVSRVQGIYGIGESPRLTGIYEATLVPICNLVSRIPSEAFRTLELLLLKHLLSGHFWSSMLSSDVWFFIGRLGTSDLCAEYVKLFIKISATLVERRDSTEAIMVDNIICRLYELLTEDMKSALLDDFIDLDTNYHIPILYSLMAKTKNFRPKQSIFKFENLPNVFSDLQTHPTTHNWKCLMQFVSAMQTINYCDNKTIIDSLRKIWTFTLDAIRDCEGKQLDILSDFIVVLFNGTRLENLQDETLNSILMSIAALCIHMLPRTKIKLCQYLRENVENLDRCEAGSAIVLTKLFNRLLEDENPWVRQEALESFERVGQVCSEQLVAEIAKNLAKIPSIRIVMQAYLSKTPYFVLEGFTNMHDYLKHVANAVQDHRNEHICPEYEESEREEKIAKVEEGNMRDIASVTHQLIQLDKQAEKFYSELTKVLEKRADISEAACKKLITILKNILETFDK